MLVAHGIILYEWPSSPHHQSNVRIWCCHGFFLTNTRAYREINVCKSFRIDSRGGNSKQCVGNHRKEAFSILNSTCTRVSDPSRASRVLRSIAFRLPTHLVHAPLRPVLGQHAVVQLQVLVKVARHEREHDVHVTAVPERLDHGHHVLVSEHVQQTNLADNRLGVPLGVEQFFHRHRPSGRLVHTLGNRAERALAHHVQNRIPVHDARA